ncbi:MAG TPA: hypothetical protein DCW31_01820 [Lactobacillus sp.]|nr:hypothetical protein [Lactobacillus sp.]
MRKWSATQTLGILTGLTAIMMLVLFIVRRLFGQFMDQTAWELSAELVIVLVLIAVNKYWLHVPLSYQWQTHGQFWSVCWLGILLVFINGGVFIGGYVVNTNATPAIEAVVMALLVGYYEESFFRGIILGQLLKSFSGKHRVILAVLTSSVLFGLTHAAHYFDGFDQSSINTTLQIGYAICLGVYFSAVTLRTGSLLWPMLMHATFDLPSLYIEFTTHSGVLSNSLSGDELLITLISDTIHYLPVLLIGLWLIRRSQLAEIAHANPEWLE